VVEYKSKRINKVTRTKRKICERIKRNPRDVKNKKIMEDWFNAQYYM
jgi:hypothetical protein